MENYKGFRITFEQIGNKYSNYIAIITDKDGFDIDETPDFPTESGALMSAKRHIDDIS